MCSAIVPPACMPLIPCEQSRKADRQTYRQTGRQKRVCLRGSQCVSVCLCVTLCVRIRVSPCVFVSLRAQVFLRACLRICFVSVFGGLVYAGGRLCQSVWRHVGAAVCDPDLRTWLRCGCGTYAHGRLSFPRAYFVACANAVAVFKPALCHCLRLCLFIGLRVGVSNCLRGCDSVRVCVCLCFCSSVLNNVGRREMAYVSLCLCVSLCVCGFFVCVCVSLCVFVCLSVSFCVFVSA